MKRKYKSTTDFDTTLELSIMESMNDQYTSSWYEGFVSEEQAKQFATWWEEKWGWGYSPSAKVREEDGKFIVRTSRYNSCD